MVLIHNFKATSFFKAFLLASIASSVIITISLISKDSVEFYLLKNKKDKDPEEKMFRWQAYLISFVITFFTSFVGLYIMNFIFGFGGGMLVILNNNQKKNS